MLIMLNTLKVTIVSDKMFLLIIKGKNVENIT
jgi:hypothetical protein